MRIFRQRGTEGEGFQRPDNMSEPLYRLLVQRGIGSVEAARAFLRPTVSMLNPPESLLGIKEATERIRTAIDKGERICVYGDYDVDGISASSIMYLTLRQLGAKCEVYLPSRHTEGYGLNENAVRSIAERAELLLTVDCGISSADLVKTAKELGLDVIVTDHHRPGETLPDCTVVNPLLGDYPDPYICGGGVAFKLSQALLGTDKAMQYIDIAALATVADIVSLTGENRVIVKLGLRAMNTAPRLGIAKLREVAGMSESQFTSGMLGFQIAPRMNASGRVGSAYRAFELLTTDDSKKAAELARELDAENSFRKQIEEEILKSAQEQTADFDFVRNRIIVISGEGWNSGVVGLAASRLVEKYHYPSIVIALNGEIGTGSCRSIPGVDIYDSLTAVSDYLVRYGGHAQAAGLTIEKDKIPAFVDALNDYLRNTIPTETYIPVSEYDTEANFSELTADFVTLMDSFAPTGMGNPAPIFRSKVKVSESRSIGKDGAHLSLRVTDDTNYMRGVMFRAGDSADTLPDKLDILYTPKINNFRGRSTVELELKAMKPLDGHDIIESSRVRENELLTHFLTDVLYNNEYSFSHANAVNPETVKETINTSPQGTLIIASDADAAEKIWDGKCDVHVGRFPDDPRAFNSICILPVGDIPRGYERIYFVGMPAYGGGTCVDTPSAYWTKTMPGRPELERAYRSVKRMLSRPIVSSSIDEYVSSLEDESLLPRSTLTACLIVFIKTGLVSFDGKTLRLVPNARVQNIEQTPVFTAIKQIKEEV